MRPGLDGASGMLVSRWSPEAAAVEEPVSLALGLLILHVASPDCVAEISPHALELNQLIILFAALKLAKAPIHVFCPAGASTLW